MTTTIFTLVLALLTTQGPSLGSPAVQMEQLSYQSEEACAAAGQRLMLEAPSTVTLGNGTILAVAFLCKPKSISEINI